MNIQEILFPQIGRCTVEELYFRKTNNGVTEGVADADKGFVKALSLVENEKRVYFDSEKSILCLKEGGKVWFDTYFNGFSMEKWQKYTVVSNLALTVKIKGKVKVTLISHEKVLDDVITTVLAAQVVDSILPESFTVTYPAGNGKGMYSFMLEALSDNTEFYGGAYTSEVPDELVRDIKIGIGICTFRREAFIEKNLKILRESILENETSPMHGHLEVFISDNGKTLDRDKLQTEHIRIYPNKNVGGAGGFTRDLIEMNACKDECGVTHALLMDDDIVIEPEALIKTWTILSLLKEEYVGAFIGGAMLRLDKQSIQVESGASWNGGMLNSLKAGLDLKYLESCLYNEFEEYTEFNAWWYCCFPLSVAKEDNLPLPIFIRGDDLEYGLRNMKTLILMNGICVWHEPFENKYSSFLEYYIMRNQLIDNSFHCPWYGKKHLKRAVWTHCKQEIMFYRYKNVELYSRGIRDFLKGPQWLMEQDGEELHKDIMASGYKFSELKDLGMPFHYPVLEESLNIQDTTKARIKRVLTLNGLFLPARGETIVPVADLKSVMFYRKKRVMHYDVTSKKAFITEKSWKDAWKCIRLTFKLNSEISRKLSKAQKAYREEGLQLRTIDSWKRYLGL